MASVQGFRRALPAVQVFSDEELHRLHIPSLFLLGARSALHDSHRVAAASAGTCPPPRWRRRSVGHLHHGRLA
ncbi:hypothetical protein [Streptosporangium roseum]|uniref:hypothetical protein n=1 Tax=Streptosporangium roseum TaxID=2001 RepID=UPI00332091A6